MYFVLSSPKSNVSYVKIFKTKSKLIEALSSGEYESSKFQSEDELKQENWLAWDCILIKGEIIIPRETKCFCVD